MVTRRPRRNPGKSLWEIGENVVSIHRPAASAAMAREPLVVSYGGGVDSTGVLVEFVRRKIVPDAILFADTGEEHPETYAYLDVMDDFLTRHEFPKITRVRYAGKKTSYSTLGGNCTQKGMLPSLAYGSHKHSCSLKFKVAPMDQWLTNHFSPIVQARRTKTPITVVRVIGYDAGINDRTRSERFTAKEPGKRGLVQWRYWYPLQEWGWDRERIRKEIAATGLPIPRKSSCVFCPSNRPHEIIEIAIATPDIAWRIIEIERHAGPNLDTLDGLWRAGVKGSRGGVPKPGSMTEFLLEWMADGRAYRSLPSLADPRISPSEVRDSAIIGPSFRRSLPVAGQDKALDAVELRSLERRGREASARLRARYEATFGPYTPGASIAAAALALREAGKKARAAQGADKVRAEALFRDAAAAYTAARMRLGASAANVRRFVDRAAQGKGAEEAEE